MTHRLGLIMLLLFAGATGATGATAAADALPAMVPDGRYLDEDRAARYRPTPPGDRARFRRLLNANIQKNPRNVVALSNRAYVFMESGDLVRARRDFDAALAASEPGSPHERHLLWSRGWASYDQEDYAATFADWQRAIALHGGEPFWAAYSLALLYWTTGQSELALQWYDVAAAGEPDWRSDEGVAQRIRRWAPAQQERMLALVEAWRQR